MTALLAFSLLVTACGGGASPAPVAATAAPTGAPSAALTPLKTRILVVVESRCCQYYIVELVGRRLGVFQEAGLDVEWIPATGTAATAMAAILSGDTDIAVFNVAALVAAAGANRPAKIITAEDFAFWDGFAITPQLAQTLAGRGVTPNSPWQDKVKALKGLKIWGGSAPSEIKLRSLFTYLGMDPDKDVTFIKGTVDAGNAAWRAGQLDVYKCCEPDTYLNRSDAVVWMKPGEIKAPIKGYATVLGTTESYAQKNPEVIKRVLAVQKTMKAMILAATPGSSERVTILKHLGDQYPTVTSEMIAASFDTTRHLYDPKTTELTRQDLQDTIDSYNAGTTADLQVKLKGEDLAAPGIVLK